MMSNPTVDDDPALLCPACGFDLRATASDRCGECGLVIDRAALQVSGIPWVYRRRIGRVRAYLKTFWQVTVDSKAIRYEAAKPQEAGDGRAFGRVTACIVAMALLAVFAAAVFADGGLTFVAIQPQNLFNSFGNSTAPMAPYLQDLLVPWSAGATIAPVMPLCLISLALCVSGAQRYVFRAPNAPALHRQRAAALSYYVTAPLILLLPALGCCTLAALLNANKLFSEYGRFQRLSLSLAPAGALLFLIAILGTIYRAAQWLMRTRHCGALGAALGIAELIGLWLLGGVVLLGLVPWCVGFLWIVIDSLR
jgi:hypothetical protein